MFSNFSEEIVMYREIYNDIKFNTKIHDLFNYKIVVVDNGVCRRLNKIEGNIINPRKKTFLNMFNKDKNEYVVFKVNENSFNGTWGGNVQYNDKRLDYNQDKIFIRATYSYKIFLPEQSIKLINEVQETYNSKYMNIVINKKIDNIIKKLMLERLDQLGFIETKNNLFKLSNIIEEMINNNILGFFGVNIYNLNMHIEENIEKN